MDLVVPDLYASASQPLPFARSLAMRSFLCRRDGGNLLVYASGSLNAEAPTIERLGGVTRHYLNHRHEGEFVSTLLGSATFIHEDDREAVAGSVDTVEAFSGRHALGNDFEVIPTPGHTPGATAYLWNTGEHRVLFTGDTIYLSEGEWVAALLESSDRDSYTASLELMCELDFDVLLPWIATRERPYHAVTDPADARRRIGAILERVSRGGDH
jgi:glyoxylase-like metal-dependent hydrolase (beta-lactamase superfamily II)